MQESQERAGLPIHSVPSSRSGWLIQATSLISIGIIVFGLVIVCMQEPSVIKESQGTGSGKDMSLAAIQLVLHTSKSRYHVGEPIEIIAYLENVSDTPYYVGGQLYGLGVISTFHHIELKITDERGREVSEPRMSITSVRNPDATIAEVIAQAYVQLRPTMIYGLKASGRRTLRAGRYRLTATYREEEALRWTETARAALPAQVWIQPLTSNIVTITVLPRASPSKGRRP